MSNYKMSKKSDGSWDLMEGSQVLVRGGSYTEVSNLLSVLERQEVGLTEAHEVADTLRMARNPSPTGGKMKSTKAGRNAVLEFLQSEGIQIVPVPHGDRKTGGQIVVMLGDGTWLEFDTQSQVVDWLAEHMERRGVKVHNPSKSKWERMTDHGLEIELRSAGPVKRKQILMEMGRRVAEQIGGTGREIADLDQQTRKIRSRRNPSSGKAFWWLIITRDDATAVGHRYESRESMMHYSKKHAANLRGDNSKALIRGTEPMTTAAFRKAFKTAYPKFTLEV